MMKNFSESNTGLPIRQPTPTKTFSSIFLRKIEGLCPKDGTPRISLQTEGFLKSLGVSLREKRTLFPTVFIAWILPTPIDSVYRRSFFGIFSARRLDCS